MAMSTSSPAALRSSANLLGGVADLRRGSRRSGRAGVVAGLVLKAVKPRASGGLDPLGAAGVGVDADPPPGRAAEQLVDRHAERLALDVPEGHVDAAQGAGQDRAAAVEGVAVDRLPVMDDLARVLADQVRLDLLDGLCHRRAPGPRRSARPGRRCRRSVWIFRNSQRGLTRKVSSLVILIRSLGRIGAKIGLPFVRHAPAMAAAWT